MRKFFEYVLIQIVISFIQVMPIEMCDRMCRFLAHVIADRFKFREKIIRENILGVFPDADDERVKTMSREMWYHLILMACEIAQAPRKDSRHKLAKARLHPRHQTDDQLFD